MKRVAAAVAALLWLASSGARTVAGGQPAAPALAPAPAEPAIQARIEPEGATVGDVVTVRLTVDV